MKILVAGAAGFIGSNLSSHLLQTTAHTVISVDDLSGTPDLDNLQFALGHRNNRHKFYLLNIADSIMLNRLIRIEKPDIIINAARSAQQGVNLNESLYSEACKYKTQLFISLEDTGLTSQNDVKAITLTIGSVFGPRQGPKCEIPKIINSVLNDLVIENLPTEEADFLYIKDLLDAICLLIEADSLASDYHHIGGTICTFENIENYLKLLVGGLPANLIAIDSDMTSSPQILSLGWKVRRPLDQALEHTLQWYNLNKWAFNN